MLKERKLLMVSIAEIILICLLSVFLTFKTICIKTISENYMNTTITNQIIDFVIDHYTNIKSEQLQSLQDDLSRSQALYRFNENAFDIENDVLEIAKSASVKLQVTLYAPNGIANVYVEIDSETLTSDILGGVGLASSFDLAHPGDLEVGLNSLGFPTGDEVIGQTELLFDITQFTSLLGIYGVAKHNFIIRLVDQNGLEITKTLKIKSIE